MKASAVPPSPGRFQFWANHQGTARKQLKFVTFSLALAMLSGCATYSGTMAPESQEQLSFVDSMDKSALAPRAGGSESQAKAAEAVRFVTENDLPRASRTINAALQLDERNSWLHFLNGFIYHLQARQGDSQKSDLAIEGYRTALRLDPGNWIAQEFLGLAFLDLKQFEKAREQFAQALLMRPDTTLSMYGLMVTSYLVGDPQMACAMADKYRQHVPGLEPTFLRSSVSVYASCGNFEEAEQMRDALRAQHADSILIQRADQRLSQWKDFYGSPKARRISYTSPDTHALQVAEAFTITQRPSPEPVVQPMYDASSLQSRPPFTSDDASNMDSSQPSTSDVSVPSRPTSATDAMLGMTLVDVVIISMQDNISTSKGINLLNALTLQLGSATVPAYSWSFDSSSASRSVITKAVTVPALSYSLNIANTNSSHNEVLARPTLAAVEGQPSKFFAGVNVNAGVLSTSALGSADVVPIDKRFGVTLAITPNFLAGGMVKLKVDAQRTFVMPNKTADGFAYRFDIAETTTNANVVMKLGDTLVLSGLNERDSSTTRDGVPGLQDLPLVQYLFSSKQVTQIQNSALILITPRAPIHAAQDQRSGNVSDSVKALRDRLGFPESIPPNVEAIVNGLNETELFRQFRQGDVSMERWERVNTTGERLRQALSFLYY